MKISIIKSSVLILLLINDFKSVESKRSFSIARSRPKSGNPSVRRKSQSINTDTSSSSLPSSQDPSSSSLSSKPIGWNTNHNDGIVSSSGIPNRQAIGSPSVAGAAPPPYSNIGNRGGFSDNLAPPPPYSLNSNQPPSYSSIYGGVGIGSSGIGTPKSYGYNYGYTSSGSLSNIGKIPPRGSSSSLSTPDIDRVSFYGLGTSHFAHHAPSHTNNLYNSHGATGNGYAPSHSSTPFSFGNILTGLTAWNLARTYNSYGSPRHDYVHHTNSTNNATMDNKG